MSRVTVGVFVAACAVLASGCNLGCLLAPCDGSLDVGVSVRDPSGAPIAGAQVSALGYSAATNDHGCAEIRGIYHPANIFSDPDLSLRAERAGYKSLRERHPINRYRIEITLQPADSSQKSTAVWTPVESSSSLECTRGATSSPGA